ncbi:MAG: DUF6247 family protein [Pseudonocardiaceae bacterium]
MTAAAATGPPPSTVGSPFADASPAQVRAALIPEDVTEFDRQWRAVMAAATETLDLTAVHRALDSWRRVAWLTQATRASTCSRVSVGRSAYCSSAISSHTGP